MPATATKSRETHTAYCPHCMLEVASDVDGDWPPQHERCPHCRLMIGAGRARWESDGAPGARGAAAGVLARDAQRQAAPARGNDDVSPDVVCEGIRAVANELGAAPERLLMVDYQQRASEDADLPDLTEVFAAFGTWKRARREAASAAA